MNSVPSTLPGSLRYGAPATQTEAATAAVPAAFSVGSAGGRLDFTSPPVSFTSHPFPLPGLQWQAYPTTPTLLQALKDLTWFKWPLNTCW